MRGDSTLSQDANGHGHSTVLAEQGHEERSEWIGFLGERALKEWEGHGGRFTGVESQLPALPTSWLYLLGIGSSGHGSRGEP